MFRAHQVRHGIDALPDIVRVEDDAIIFEFAMLEGRLRFEKLPQRLIRGFQIQVKRFEAGRQRVIEEHEEPVSRRGHGQVHPRQIAAPEDARFLAFDAFDHRDLFLDRNTVINRLRRTRRQIRQRGGVIQPAFAVFGKINGIILIFRQLFQRHRFFRKLRRPPLEQFGQNFLAVHQDFAGEIGRGRFERLRIRRQRPEHEQVFLRRAPGEFLLALRQQPLDGFANERLVLFACAVNLQQGFRHRRRRPHIRGMDPGQAVSLS